MNPEMLLRQIVADQTVTIYVLRSQLEAAQREIEKLRPKTEEKPKASNGDKP
jgi:hypothetical protein